jgi:hypothetical protein
MCPNKNCGVDLIKIDITHKYIIINRLSPTRSCGQTMIGLIAMNILPTGSEKAEDAIYLAVHYIVHVGICILYITHRAYEHIVEDI